MTADRGYWYCPFCGSTDLYIYPDQEQANANLAFHIQRRHP